jgi:signal transduction histidine kinase
VGAVTTGFAEAIADRIAAEHALLAARWFARLQELLPVGAEEVFPSDSLLDHIPALILDISDYVRAPEEQAIAANTMVVDKARELGALRHQQRASLHQVLREHQLLGSILLRFVQDEWIRQLLTPTPEESMTVVTRIHQAVAVLLQETVETFVSLYNRTIAEQSERLQQFTRMATHEWRQPLAPIRTAVSLLRLTDLPAAQRGQIVEMIDRNVQSLVTMTHTLERVARIDANADNASLQEVSVSMVAGEAARQLRDMAEARGVAIHITEGTPAVTVDVGRLELALVNLLSNAIKYCDMEKRDRFVAVTSRRLDGGAVEIIVRDNGVGIPEARLAHIFRRFTRAHADRADLEAVGGLGLGLAIVDDCVTAMRGTITVESKEGSGTAFVMTLPATPRATP